VKTARDILPFMLALWASAAVATAVAWLVKLVLPVSDPFVRAGAILGTFGGVYVGITLLAGMREPVAVIGQLRSSLRR
jgi:hypothetical protein